jgi:hypothetical protein
MLYGLPVAVFVEMRGQQRRVQAEVPVQKARQIGRGRIDGGQYLDTIAGGEKDALADTGHGGQGARGLRQIVAGDGKALAQLDWRGLVVDANEEKAHRGPYLCTWLKTLATSTLNITRKTAPQSQAALRPRRPAVRRTRSSAT